MTAINAIVRPTDVPDSGLLCDLLWSDPDKDIAGWGDNDRGTCPGSTFNNFRREIPSHLPLLPPSLLYLHRASRSARKFPADAPNIGMECE